MRVKADARHRSVFVCAPDRFVPGNSCACVGSHPCTNGRIAACARRHQESRVRVLPQTPARLHQDNIILPVLDLGLNTQRVAPPDQLQQHAVRVRYKRILVGRAAGEELLGSEREAK